MTKRPSISKKKRFDIFKRDGFSCQYCGATPPSTVLHLDHLHPVCKGGGNESDNLITSCKACNQGKAGTPLTVIPQSLAEKSADIQERELQLKGYYEIIQAKRDRIEEETWIIIDIFDRDLRKKGVRKDWLKSISMFIDKIGFYEVIDAAEIATAKCHYSMHKSFPYFCGVCWNKAKDIKNG